MVDVDVVRETDGDAARGRPRQRVAHDRTDRAGQVDVVDRDLERLLRRRDELGERVRDLVGGLPAVGERADVYCAVFARSDALYARLAAW